MEVKRILVVDDDTMNLKRTKMILGKTYDVEMVESGREALEKMRREDFDLVLLDIAMPEMDGIETFERMKASAYDVPVIFLTASGYEDDVRKITGAVNYLKKPFFPQELLKRVAKEFDKE